MLEPTAPRRVSPEMRAALRMVAESHPGGSVVAVLREHLLDLLEPQLNAPRIADKPPAADLTCRQVADALGRDGSTIRSWVARGEFPGAYRLNGREWRIPPESLRSWQDAQRARPTVSLPNRAGARRGQRLSSWRSMVAEGHR